VSIETTYVVIAKVFVNVFAGTVTVVGTDAAVGSELVRAITAPPAGAGPVSVIVPVVGLPPRMLEFATVKVLTLAAVTFKTTLTVPAGQKKATFTVTTFPTASDTTSTISGRKRERP